MPEILTLTRLTSILSPMVPQIQSVTTVSFLRQWYYGYSSKRGVHHHSSAFALHSLPTIRTILKLKSSVKNTNYYKKAIDFYS